MVAPMGMRAMVMMFVSVGVTMGMLIIVMMVVGITFVFIMSGHQKTPSLNAIAIIPLETALWQGDVQRS
jgi:hypothetical protein